MKNRKKRKDKRNNLIYSSYNEKAMEKIAKSNFEKGMIS